MSIQESIDHVRNSGLVPFAGECSSCGKDRVVAMKPSEEIKAESSGKWFRCNNPECEQINWLEKRNS